MAQDTMWLPYVYVGTTVSAATVLPVLGTLLTANRFYVRRHSGPKQRLEMDDWLALAAMVCYWAMCAIVLRGVAVGIVGVPASKAKPEDYGRLQYAFWVPHVIAFGCIKVSLLFYYRRVFAIKSGALNVITWTAIAISVAWTVAFLLTTLLACGTHVSSYWHLRGTGYSCLPPSSHYLAQAASDFITDVFIFLLPMPLVWKMDMELRKKLSLSAVFLTGGMSIVAAALRLTIYIQGAHWLVATSYDPSLLNTLAQYWSLVEAGLAIIAINLPALGQLFVLDHVRLALRSVCVSYKQIRKFTLETFTTTVHDKGVDSAERGLPTVAYCGP